MNKRILFLTPQLPYPPHQGAALRNYGLIKGLAERGHRVALLSFLESDQPALSDTPLDTWCDPAITVAAPLRSRSQRLRDLLSGYADMACRLWSEDFDTALRILLQNFAFDVIQIEGIEMAPYLPTIKQYAPNAKLIYDAHNAEYALQWRAAINDLRSLPRLPTALYSLIQSARLTRFETETCRAVHHIFACSQTDANLLGRLRHQTPIAVIPNAIQFENYREVDLPEVEIKHPALVFTGKMDFRPNIDAVLWFAQEILSRIRKEFPEAHFTAVGQKPHPRLAVLYGRPDVTLTGFVPDIRPYYRQAEVYVAPLRMGSGTRFKLLEAMAMGCAIVSTPLGAEGIAVENGREMVLAGTADDFARAVIALLKDRDCRVALGSNAAKLVESTYNWPAVIPRVETIYTASTAPGSA